FAMQHSFIKNVALGIRARPIWPHQYVAILHFGQAFFACCGNKTQASMSTSRAASQAIVLNR
ncbi:hypothetical protein ACFOFO_06095, partial [Undibacterium arcticum]